MGASRDQASARGRSGQEEKLGIPHSLRDSRRQDPEQLRKPGVPS